MEDIYCWESKFQACDYSSRLINKLKILNRKFNQTLDIKEITKAIYYARKYHASQIRQSGELYYSHPIEVAYMLAEYAANYDVQYFTTDLIVTSILHDCIEDTTLTKQAIEEIFGAVIAEKVQDLTRIKPEGKISSAKMLEILYKEKKYDVLMVKIFDRCHNLKTINSKPSYKIEKTIHETLSRFVSLSIYLKIPFIEDILNNISSGDTNETVKTGRYNNFVLPFLI